MIDNTIGRYRTEALLGAGGMGEVYLAHDDQLDRKVAIKLLNKRFEGNESNVQRFIQEAKAASALNHPNILTIHEIGRTEDSHYIVSEFVEGHTLRTILNSETIDLLKILDISTQIAAALSAAHSARIIHRDIKPENVVVRNDGYIKVVDFGLAKLLPDRRSLVGLDDETVRQNQTAKGLILGTVNYMSPEQAKGEPVDARTDIFSLGALLYEMVTGRTPFTANSTSETLANLINREPEPMYRYAPGVPDELQRIVSKMLRKDPDERYQTMKGLLADLKDLKERVTLENKLARSSSAENAVVTEVFGRTGDGTTKKTIETAGGRTALRRMLVLAAVPILLGGALAAGWYWLRPVAESHAKIKSLAVLPLRSLDSSENLIGFGIADAVIRRISQTGKLTVRPTSAVRRYMTEETDALTAAKQLTADAVLEGTVLRSGDRLRVSVNLLRTSDGSSLWAQVFETQASDVFVIQDTVSQQVASRLQLQLDPAQQDRLAKHTTSDPIAYEYYIKGLNSLDQRGFGPKAKPQIDATIELFKKAIEADPNYALARARLAFTYIHKGLFIAPDEEETLARLAKEEINRADSIDPQLAETHVARSWFLFSGYESYQVEAAAREVLMAQQLDPNVGHADLAGSFYHMGLDDLTEREYKRAIEIDPTSEFNKNQFVNYYYYTARWDDYFTALQQYLPGEPPDPYYFIIKGRLAEAEKAVEEFAVKEPDSPYHAANRAMLYAARGSYVEAEDETEMFIKSLDKRVPSYHHDVYTIATIYAVMGKTGEAMKWLRESAETGFPSYTTFERDPFLDRIRQTPEFIQFMNDMKPIYEKRRREFQ